MAGIGHPVLGDDKYGMEFKLLKHKGLFLAAVGIDFKHPVTDEELSFSLEMKSQNINLREWSKEFFELLNNNNIPLLILSAGWLGTLSIEKYLENQKSLSDNIHLIWNEFIRDGDRAIDFKKPIIHTFNKDETVIKDFPEINQKVYTPHCEI